MYVVVLKNTRNDAMKKRLCWTTFRDKNHFEAWFNFKMQLSFVLIKQDLSEKEAIDLCTDKEAATSKNNGQRMRRVFLKILQRNQLILTILVLQKTQPDPVIFRGLFYFI